MHVMLVFHHFADPNWFAAKGGFANKESVKIFVDFSKKMIRHFGDFADPDSNVSRQVADGASFQMHAELGTEPGIRYLYETPAVPGREPAPVSRAAEGGRATPGYTRQCARVWPRTG